MIRSLDHADFPTEALLAAKDRPVSVVLPARDCADTVGSVVERIAALDGLVDQILVVDGNSSDDTMAVATAAGAQVAAEAELMPDTAPCWARATPCGARSRRSPATWWPTSTPTRATSTRAS